MPSALVAGLHTTLRFLKEDEAIMEILLEHGVDVDRRHKLEEADTVNEQSQRCWKGFTIRSTLIMKREGDHANHTRRLANNLHINICMTLEELVYLLGIAMRHDHQSSTE